MKKKTPPRTRPRFYIYRPLDKPGEWLFSLCIGPWLLEGATWWRGFFRWGRRTYS